MTLQALIARVRAGTITQVDLLAALEALAAPALSPAVSSPWTRERIVAEWDKRIKHLVSTMTPNMTPVAFAAAVGAIKRLRKVTTVEAFKARATTVFHADTSFDMDFSRAAVAAVAEVMFHIRRSGDLQLHADKQTAAAYEGHTDKPVSLVIIPYLAAGKEVLVKGRALF